MYDKYINYQQYSPFTFFIQLDYRRQQPPAYTIDWANSVYTSKSLNYSGSEYIITVEQGHRFYLALNLNAWPCPTKANLYKNGHLVESSPKGTIFVDVDRMGIQIVDRQAYEGRYTIESTNEAGTGEISFHLKVKCTY